MSSLDMVTSERAVQGLSRAWVHAFSSLRPILSMPFKPLWRVTKSPPWKKLLLKVKSSSLQPVAVISSPATTFQS